MTNVVEQPFVYDDVGAISIIAQTRSIVEAILRDTLWVSLEIKDR